MLINIGHHIDTTSFFFYNNFMKKLLAIIILGLCFTTPSQADNIRDFQIEGISIDDSLLQYFSKNELENSISPVQYPKNKYTILWLKKLKFNLKTYDALTIAYKTYDNKYHVHSIIGSIYYKENEIKKCLKKMREIDKELSNTFQNANRIFAEKQKHTYDKTGKSTMTGSVFILKSGNKVQNTCYDWSKTLQIKERRVDELGVSLSLKSFTDWVENEAYK